MVVSLEKVYWKLSQQMDQVKGSMPRREVGNQSLKTADSAFIEGQKPYELLGVNQASKILGRFIAPFQMGFPDGFGDRMGSFSSSNTEKDLFFNGRLFYISADVCEQNPGDCKVSVKEEPWQSTSKGPGKPYIPDKPDGAFANFVNRTPSRFPLGKTATNPYIDDLKPANQIHGCSKRIVFGDFTANNSSVGSPKYGTAIRAWGAKVTFEISDSERTVALMRYRFKLITSLTSPHIATFHITGEVVLPN